LLNCGFVLALRGFAKTNRSRKVNFWLYFDSVVKDTLLIPLQPKYWLIGFRKPQTATTVRTLQNRGSHYRVLKKPINSHRGFVGIVLWSAPFAKVQVEG